MMKNKRGISPLVATVLLVAIVIIIGVLIFFWYTDVLEKQQEKEQLTSELICSQKVEFKLESVGCFKSTENNADEYNIVFKVENTGEAHINKFKVIVRDKDSGNVLANMQTGTGVNFPQTEQLSIKIDSGLLNNQKLEVEVIPIIIRSNTAKECTSKIRTTEHTCSL